MPEHVEGSEDANKNAIFNAKFEHDGYVDHSTWIHKCEETQVSVTQKRIRRTARQDQMKHADFAEVASNDDIAAFISDLRHTVLKFQVGKKKELSHTEMASAQESILSGAALLCEDDYSNALEEWKLSSSPFSSPLSSHKKGNVFLHSYAKAVRNQGIDANLKTLVKEARKCRKRLPLPSTNSAIYVCFAEERMDLCRVVISGPIDTPYQHGLFEFDINFPPSYPQIPPRVTFMTTGTSILSLVKINGSAIAELPHFHRNRRWTCPLQP